MKRVGFIGLGLMGDPMARNVLRRDFPLTVYDVVEPRMEALVAEGAKAARSPREVAAASDVVLTILPASADVEAVILGPGGVVEGAAPGLAVVEMSTIDPHVTQRLAAALAARGLRMLDAPVGRPSTFAASAELIFMVGGDAALLEELRPVLLAMGNTILHCGESGMGASMKAVNNLLSITTLAVTGEALVLGAKAGLRAEVMLDVFRRTAADNAHLRMTYPDKALRGDFSPMFMVDLAHKDLSVALALGAHQQVPVTLGAVAREMFTRARARGRGKLDWTALITVLEDEAGVKVRNV
ncbi:MAG TPA: NAD(P)-binding domain-containing protein [Candidatus Methylomirabilis sp.]|nr:NAD(P)-binding domain-containing protein [Candidatus Methylomirabilis sp.]